MTKTCVRTAAQHAVGRREVVRLSLPWKQQYSTKRATVVMNILLVTRIPTIACPHPQLKTETCISRWRSRTCIVSPDSMNIFLEVSTRGPIPSAHEWRCLVFHTFSKSWPVGYGGPLNFNAAYCSIHRARSFFFGEGEGASNTLVDIVQRLHFGGLFRSRIPGPNLSVASISA